MPQAPGTSILWRRLDGPGHDTCRLEEQTDGWALDGVAVFAHEGTPARLAYRVACDREWRARDGQVRGWLGEQLVDWYIAHIAGAWTLNDVECPGLAGCVDLDFGFTPATNLCQVRRIALAVGQSAEVPVAWLDAGSSRLERLAQRYQRRAELAYWYESPRFNYAGLLELTPAGFARRYPDLWEAVA
jgi:hypothetical protein